MEYDDAVAWTKEHPNWLDELARRSSFSVPLPARDSDLFLTAEPPSLLPSPSPSSAGPLLLPPQPYTAQTDSNSDFDPDLEEAIRLSKLEQQQYFTPEDPQVACAESVDSPASMEAEATEVEVEVKMPNSTAPQACSNQRPRLRFFRWSLWTMFMGCTRRSKARRRRTSSERSLKSVSFLCFSTFPTFEADPPHPSADPEIGTAALSVAMTGCTLESRFIVQLLLLSYVKPPYDYNRSQYVTEGFTKWACKTTKGYVEGIKTGCAFVSLLFQRFRCGTDSYSPQSTTPNPSSPLRSIKPLNGSSTSLTTSDLSRVR
jgi:hypothetical protein